MPTENIWKIIAGMYSTAVWGFIAFNLFGFLQLQQQILNYAYRSQGGFLIVMLLIFADTIAIFGMPYIIVSILKESKPKS